MRAQVSSGGGARPSITAFFPCYNDARTIRGIVAAADETLRRHTDNYEIIVINDASPDDAAAVLARAQAEFPRLRVITHAENRNYGGALRSGFEAATKELIFYTDGDGQYDPRELDRLLAVLTDGVDVVNGYKTSRHDAWIRRILGSLYNRIATGLLGIPMRDIDCDFRLFRASAARELRLTRNGGIVCAEMMLQIFRRGFVVREVAVSHHPRRFGRSQFFRPANVLGLALDFMRIWWHTRRTERRPRAPAVASVPEGSAPAVGRGDPA